MKQPEFTMDDGARAVVDQAIRDHCVHRQWTIHALNVRTNHVHIVVTCQPRYSPELATKQFKEWGTRRLRDGGFVSADREVWTDHGSMRWINEEVGFAEAVDYVMNCQ